MADESFRRYDNEGLADLADRGRYGDSMLVHMAPEEVAGLASLTRNGVTINPDTGLPEMFSLRNILPTIIGIGANLIPGVAPLGAAAISGLATGLLSEGTTSEKIGRGLLAGVGSWGMGKIGGMLGGAGAKAAGGLPGIPPEFGAQLLTPTGDIVPWQQLPPQAHKLLGQAGISSANYMQAMDPIKASLVPPSPDLRLFGTGAPSYDIPARQTAVGGGLNPLLAGPQAADVYQNAPLRDRWGLIKGGVEQVDLGSWADADPGMIPVGSFATPAVAAVTGGLGTLFPEQPYEPPSGPSYAYRGPYARPPRRYSAPPGYIPGVSPEPRYFARGGTAGRTVRGGLPTIYAQYGFDPGDAEAGAFGAAAAAEAAEADAGVDAMFGGLSGLVDTPSVITPSEDLTGRPPWAEATPYAQRAMTPEISANARAFAELHERPIPEMVGLQTAVDKARADDKKGFIPGMFDFTTPTVQFDEELGRPVVNYDALNMGKAIGTGVGALVGLPFGGTIGGAMSQPSFDVPGMPGDWGPEGEGGFDNEEEMRRLAHEAEADIASDSVPDTSPTTVTIPSYQTSQYPGSSYRPGVDPMWQYYAQEGTEGMTIEENIDVQEQVEMPAGAASTAGIMQGAPMEVQGDVEARLQERPIEGPQNPRERAIYDRAVMALQGNLEPETAQRAIDEFLEVFGPDAFRVLQEMVSEESRETGGVVEPVGEETTVMEGEIQGPDVIAGKVVDPVTGEVTADLRVGENEYIEPADSLVRRATVAGLPPTPENGAMVRGEEERMLQRMVG